MLSILIPIYNCDTRQLVQTLHQQALSTGIEYEILLLDDASDNENVCHINQQLKNLPSVTLFELPTTAGRAVARNFLAGQAKYKHLLFLDCDTEVVDDNYINRYIPYCNKKDIVVCGGIAYKQEQPSQNAKLRWIYGKKYEEKMSKANAKNETKRAANEITSFSSFNFLIDKDLFWSIRFNELLKNYGHEDTLLGIELQKRNYHITHIDNPLYHIGIDDTDTYLNKTEKGVENLKILLNQYPDRDSLIKYIRLLKFYHALEKTHSVGFVRVLYRFTRSLMLKNLRSKHPNLTIFNLYKLGYLCYLMSAKKNFAL